MFRIVTMGRRREGRMSCLDFLEVLIGFLVYKSLLYRPYINLTLRLNYDRHIIILLEDVHSWIWAYSKVGHMEILLQDYRWCVFRSMDANRQLFTLISGDSSSCISYDANMEIKTLKAVECVWQTHGKLWCQNVESTRWIPSLPSVHSRGDEIQKHYQSSMHQCSLWLDGVTNLTD